MDKIIGYVAFVFRLAFLPFQKHLISKKWKIVIMLTANVVMMIAVFVISIQPQRSRLFQERPYCAEEYILKAQLSRLNAILFKQARQPNIITIVPSAILEAQRMQDSIAAANALSLEDAKLLLEILSEK